MGVVVRADSRWYWLNLERAGLPAIREATRILAKGLPEHLAKENRRLAEQTYHARMTDLARRHAGLPLDRERVTFRLFAAWYLEHVTPTKRSAARERSSLKHLIDYFGRLPLDAIDQPVVREYTTARLRSKIKPTTVNRELDVLKSLLVAAVPKYLAVSPIAGMKRLRSVSPVTGVLTFAQERALLKVMSPQERAVLIAGLDALLRLSDLCRLQWKHDKGTHLEIVDPKVAAYTVPVSQRLRKALDSLNRDAGPYVFGYLRKRRHGRPGPNAIIALFHEACRRANVPHGRPEGVTFHSLRHTGATRALAVPGTSLRDLMALGGWRDLKSVQRYTRPTQADRTLVDRMSRTQTVHGKVRHSRKR